ncbi:MAG: thermonuclease family protein [Acidobacteria bacterium]|nr:thermonuclease family protein [Acidobacteriota bacterium]
MRNLLIILNLLILVNSFVIEAKAQKAKAKEPVKNVTTSSNTTTSLVVEQVINGDLVKLTNGELVRLIGADAPVTSVSNQPGQEPWASEARTFTERLAIGKEITINNLGLSADEYGRRIGLIYIYDLWLDYELVKEGLAVVQSNRYLDNKSKQQLLDAQSEAIKAGKGIWNAENRMPLPPKEFRAANGIEEGNKNESWKNIASKSPQSKSVNTSNSSSKTTDPSSSDTTSVSSVVSKEALDSLKQIQEKLEGGLRSNEIAKLVAIADGKVQAASSVSKVDRILVRNLKDALDAYKLVLDAFKKRETATDAERPRYDKFIDGALEIADKSIIEAETKCCK